MPDITVYPVRRLITMNPALPSAEAVAVRGDRILGVGSLDELTRWGDHRVDDTFRDHVLTPGFVEAHSHVMSGGTWEHVASASSTDAIRPVASGLAARASTRWSPAAAGRRRND